MNDSAYYVGACPDCNVTLDHVRGENAPQGYSGTNSGGHIVVKNSEFDNNETGFATGDLNNDDAPGPQDGTCPGGAVNPAAPQNVQRKNVCWVFTNNYIHDNNNPNVPEVGQAGSTPLGVGLSLSGARNDTVMNNRIVRNNAWGVLIQVQQGEGGPPCIDGVLNFTFFGITLQCLFDNWGNAILNNRFADNGSFGHATNGDIAAYNLLSGNPTNCYRGNTDPKGLTTSPAGLEQSHPACTGAAADASPNVPLIEEVLCGNEGVLVGVSIKCPGGKQYPARTHVAMHALPSNLATMPNPCRGVPANPWCRASAAASRPPRRSSGFTG